MKFTVVKADSFEALYVDGKKVAEHENIGPWDILRVVGGEYTERWLSCEGAADLCDTGRFPDKLEDVKV